nr:hypothetical protein [Tanacetum cinerariifolium]
AFPLPVIEFSLPELAPTVSEESSYYQKKREAIAVKIALLLKSRRNYQSKSDDSYANTEKLMNEIGELRAITSHVLRASGVQIPQNNLDNLRLTEEEDEATKVLYPRDVSGSILLEIIDFAILGLLLEPLVLGAIATNFSLGRVRCTI